MANTSNVAIFPDFAHMTTAMQGQNTTDGWDVVCSYDLKKLNAILSDRFRQGKLISKVNGVTTWDWILELDAVKISDYVFELSEPVLNFNVDGRATLTMPITKITDTVHVFTLSEHEAVDGHYKADTWYSKDGDTYKPIANQSTPVIGNFVPAQGKWYSIATMKPPSVNTDTEQTHSLVGSIPISAITGDNQIYNQGTVVVFKAANSADKAHIVLHFSQTAANTATYTISPPLTNDDFNKEATLLRAIANFFSTEVSQIEYALTAVSPAPDPNGNTVITPKSFAFSAIKTGDDAGVLGTFIETSQNKGRGQSDPVFTVGGTKYSPIPTGNTASMIFSQDFVQNILIGTAISKNMNGGHAKYVNQSSGVQAKIYAKDIEIKIHIPTTETYVETFPAPPHGMPPPPIYNYIRVQNDVLSSEDYPITLTLNKNTASVAWNIDHASFDYELGWNSPSLFDSHPSINWSKDTGHKISISIHSSTSSPSTFSIDAACDISLAPQLTFDNSTYSAEVTPKPAHKNCWQKFWSGDAANQIHSALQSALANFAPKLSLTMPGLNYFATTNILFPGAHVFQADTAAGLQIPRDLILLGNIEKKS